MLLQFLTALSGAVTLIAGGIAIYDKVRQVPKPHQTKVAFGTAIFTLILTIIFLVASMLSHGSLPPASTPTPAPDPAISNAPTPTPDPAISFTSSPTPSPTATSTPLPSPTVLTLAPVETLSENIRLNCVCSDPVVVTITKIQILPTQMIWSLTFSNNSQQEADAVFYQFYLEDGNQTTYQATGGGVDTTLSLQVGDKQSTTLTFSFVPYKDIPYTLYSELGGLFNGFLAYKVPFNPDVIQF